MLFDNRALFKSVNEALYQLDNSGGYRRLPGKVAKFLRKYYDAKASPHHAYGSFQPSQFVRPITTPPVPLQSDKVVKYFSLYSKAKSLFSSKDYSGNEVIVGNIKYYSYKLYGELMNPNQVLTIVPHLDNIMEAFYDAQVNCRSETERKVNADSF